MTKIRKKSLFSILDLNNLLRLSARSINNVYLYHNRPKSDFEIFDVFEILTIFEKTHFWIIVKKRENCENDIFSGSIFIKNIYTEILHI
jgi:hypothetical protein